MESKNIHSLGKDFALEVVELMIDKQIWHTAFFLFPQVKSKEFCVLGQ